MKQIFVVYETDAWHSTSHRDCAGVFTSKWAAVNAIVKNHRIELDTMTSRSGISMNGILLNIKRYDQQAEKSHD